MKLLKLAFILMLPILLLLSCKPRELPKEKEVVTITKTITEVKRDTLVKIEADSSFYNALIECQNGKPVLLQPLPRVENTNSHVKNSEKGLQTPKVDLDKDGKLKIACQYFENLYKITLREKQILEEKLSEKTVIPPPEYIEKELSWWQKLWIVLGKIFAGLLIVYIGYKIIWKASLPL